MSAYALADGTRPDTRVGLELQPIVPLRLWAVDTIVRLTLPYQVAGDGPDGVDDIQIIDLVVIETAAGRLGVGPVANFSAREKEVPSHVSGGPAVGFVGRVTDALNLGFLSQNFFASGVAISMVQPVVALQLGHGWAMSTGDMQLVFDWREMTLLHAPIQLELSKVVEVGAPSLRFAAGLAYDFKENPGADRVVVKLTFELLLPEHT